MNKLCAIGKVHFYRQTMPICKGGKRRGAGDGIANELQRLEIAFHSTEEELYEGERSVLHEELHESARLAVFEGYEAADAVLFAAERIFSQLSQKEDPYISEMGAQVGRMTSHLVRILSKEKPDEAVPSPKSVILICENITVKELMSASRSMILGIVLCDVPPLSELAIYAHSLGVPLIICEKGRFFNILEGETAIIDGEIGVLIASPEEETVEHYGVRLGGIALSREKNGRKNRIICCSIVEALHGEHGMGLCGSALLLNVRKKGGEELNMVFSAILDELDGGELKIILPREEKMRAEVISCAIKASGKGEFILLLPSAIDISAIRTLKYTLASELEEESENITVGAVIDCGAAIHLIKDIAEETAFLAVDSDSLTSSLLFPETVQAKDEELLDIGTEAFLKAAEALIEEAKRKGLKICFFGMTASRDEICEKLISLGANEIAIPYSYLI